MSKQSIATATFAGILGLFLFPGFAFGHCQVPCGIYNDEARFTLLSEQIATIEKSMKRIVSLSQAKKPDWNQIVRWVANKDEHADKFSNIVTYYFLAQRIKPVAVSDKAGRAAYLERLELLHRMMVTAMKCKQSTDLERVAELRVLLGKFRVEYLGEAGHHH